MIHKNLLWSRFSFFTIKGMYMKGDKASTSNMIMLIDFNFTLDPNGPFALF